MGLILGGPREISVMGGSKFLGGPLNSGGTWKAEGHHVAIVMSYHMSLFLVVSQ